MSTSLPARLFALVLLIGSPCIASCATRSAQSLAPPPSSTQSRMVAATQAVEVPAPAPLTPLQLEGGLATIRDAYNQTYANRSIQPNGYRLEPNAFLLESLDRIAAQQAFEQRVRHALPLAQPCALEVAMGDGRNAIALAQRGYQTTGFDLSDVGVNRARQRAAALGVSNRLSAQLADAYTFDYGKDRWNLIVMMYFYPGPNYMQRIKDAIKPGGYYILEVKDESHANEILAQFIDWEVIHYEHDRLQRDWTPSYSPGPGPCLRLLVRKP